MKIYTVQDITDRKQAEDELERRNEFIETILDNLPIGLAVNKISDSSISYMNKKFEEICGWPNEEIKDVSTFFKKIYPDSEYRKKILKRGAADIASDDASRMNWTDLKATGMNGKQRIISAMNIPLSDQDVMISTVQDISEQYNAKENLKQSEEKFRQLAEMLPVTVFEVGLTGRLTFVNRNAYEVFYYVEDEFKQGLDAIDMIAPSDRNRAVDNIGKVLKGEKIGLTEYDAIKKDGTIFPVMVYSSRIFTGTEISGLRGVIIDISDQKALEVQLRQSQKMESIGTLAGGIAHDFNNILTVILGNTELAIDDTPEWKPTREYLTQTKIASLRAKDLIKQLLTFTRKSDQKQQPTKLSTVIKESLILLRSSISTNIELNYKFSDDCFTINADSTQIHQVLINIVINASHAIEGSGTIGVELENTRVDQRQVALIEV
jgi:PAS domain S-box-containing protein